MGELKALENGFEYIEIINDAACAEIALQGAHVFHYARHTQEPLLWLSDESLFEKGTAIRGGIPICWPSFGMNNPKLPQHGFARIFLWDLVSVEELDLKTTQVILSLKDDEKSRNFWNNAFDLELKITVSEQLTLELTTVNTDKKSYIITQALHSYFHISKIENIAIKGLDSKPYLDALTGNMQIQNGDIIFDQEIDRVYQEVDQSIYIKDQSRVIQIQNFGSSSSVVWNPWIDKCKRMSGMSDTAYTEFVCVESANAFDDFKKLEPGESHTLRAIIE